MDVAKALELGAEGVLLASGVTKAKDVHAVLADLVASLKGKPNEFAVPSLPSSRSPQGTFQWWQMLQVISCLASGKAANGSARALALSTFFARRVDEGEGLLISVELKGTSCSTQTPRRHATTLRRNASMLSEIGCCRAQ